MTKTEIATLTAYQCICMVDQEPHLVRDEGFRRQEAAAKKMARLRKQLDQAAKEHEQAQEVIKVALHELSR